MALGHPQPVEAPSFHGRPNESSTDSQSPIWNLHPTFQSTPERIPQPIRIIPCLSLFPQHLFQVLVRRKLSQTGCKLPRSRIPIPQPPSRGNITLLCRRTILVFQHRQLLIHIDVLFGKARRPQKCLSSFIGRRDFSNTTRPSCLFVHWRPHLIFASQRIKAIVITRDKIEVTHHDDPEPTFPRDKTTLRQPSLLVMLNSPPNDIHLRNPDVVIPR